MSEAARAAETLAMGREALQQLEQRLRVSSTTTSLPDKYDNERREGTNFPSLRNTARPQSAMSHKQSVTSSQPRPSSATGTESGLDPSTYGVEVPDVTFDNRSETSGKALSTASDRRLLDQLPRDTRLSNRGESLGLTVEELDDRGLLDGGASVPSYFTSRRQRSRRTLELQSRSHRLQERGKEVVSRTTAALSHMLRVLARHGLDLESTFCSLDLCMMMRSSSNHEKESPDGSRDGVSGIIQRKIWLQVLRALELPFTIKELTEIAAQYLPSEDLLRECEMNERWKRQNVRDLVDWQAFLSDSRVRVENEKVSDMKSTLAGLDGSADVIGEGICEVGEDANGTDNGMVVLSFVLGSTSPNNMIIKKDQNLPVVMELGPTESLKSLDSITDRKDREVNLVLPKISDSQESIVTVKLPRSILYRIKSRLLESMAVLEKQSDDVYRMFARWDTHGSGSVTATQFLRVLTRLHIELSEGEQDLVVELLDTSGMGRIDFESLLAYFLGTSSSTGIVDPLLAGGWSGTCNSPPGTIGFDDGAGETVSAVSLDGNTSVEWRSLPSTTAGGSGGGFGTRLTVTPSNTLRKVRPYSASMRAPETAVLGTPPSLLNSSVVASSSRGVPGNNTPQVNTVNGALQNPRRMGTEPSLEVNGHPEFTPRTINGISVGDRVRPLTALARLPVSQQRGNNLPRNDSLGQVSFTDCAVVTLPDDADVMAGEEHYLPTSNTPSIQLPHTTVAPASSRGIGMNETMVWTGVDSGPGVLNGDSELLDGSYLATSSHGGFPSDSIPVTPEATDNAHPNMHPSTYGMNDQEYHYHTYADQISRAAPDSQTRAFMSFHHYPQTQVMIHDSPQAYQLAAQQQWHHWQNQQWAAAAYHYAQSQNSSQNVHHHQHNYPHLPDTNSSAHASSWIQKYPVGGVGYPILGAHNEETFPQDAPPLTPTGGDACSLSSPVSGKPPVWNSTRHPNPPSSEAASVDGSTGLEGNTSGSIQQTFSHNSNLLASSTDQEPSEHLNLLTTQTLETLRDLLTARYRRGRSVRELFHQIDTGHKGYFNEMDLIHSLAELSIEVSERVAQIAVSWMGRDSSIEILAERNGNNEAGTNRGRVTFGEFCVFLKDVDHIQLELRVCQQVAANFEQRGRDFITELEGVFLRAAEEERGTSEEEPSIRRGTHSNSIANSLTGLTLSRRLFTDAMMRSGLVLTSAEYARLVERFDVHGDDRCSVSRYLAMLYTSRSWSHAVTVLAFQDEAREEAATVRQILVTAARKGGQSNGVNFGHPMLKDLPELSEELVSMCEYLGIRVLSEPSMLWIAADALKAPLPLHWTAQQDATGRTFFYHTITRQSRWEHPLDSHFRNLRDKYRQGDVDGDACNEPHQADHLSGNAPPPLSTAVFQHSPPQIDDYAPKVDSRIQKTRPLTSIIHGPGTSSNGGKFRPQSAAPEITMIYNGNKGTSGTGGSEEKTTSRPVSAPMRGPLVSTPVLKPTGRKEIIPSGIAAERAAPEANGNGILFPLPDLSSVPFQMPKVKNQNFTSGATASVPSRHPSTASTSQSKAQQIWHNAAHIYSTPYISANGNILSPFAASNSSNTLETPSNRPSMNNSRAGVRDLLNERRSRNPSAGRSRDLVPGTTSHNSTRPRSAVDRAISIGKALDKELQRSGSSSRLRGSISTNNLSQKQDRISEMLSDDLLVRLDSRFTPAESSNAAYRRI